MASSALRKPQVPTSYLHALWLRNSLLCNVHNGWGSHQKARRQKRPNELQVKRESNIMWTSYKESLFDSFHTVHSFIHWRHPWHEISAGNWLARPSSLTSNPSSPSVLPLPKLPELIGAAHSVRPTDDQKCTFYCRPSLAPSLIRDRQTGKGGVGSKV